MRHPLAGLIVLEYSAYAVDGRPDLNRVISSPPTPANADRVRSLITAYAEYLNLPLRAHELLHDVPLDDVSVVDLPGGGADRSVADIRALESDAAPSRIANALYGVRHVLGRVLDWDRVPIRPEESLLSRLAERDRRESEITPGARDGPFLLLYPFPGEALSETRNATVHGYVCTALARTASGYRLYWAVYVRPVSWLTRPYLIAIEPFRRFILTRPCFAGSTVRGSPPTAPPPSRLRKIGG